MPDLFDKYRLDEEVRKRFRTVFTAMGAQQRECKLCKRPIWFLGKNPFSDDGVSHFADCPEAEKFRREKLSPPVNLTGPKS